MPRSGLVGMRWLLQDEQEGGSNRSKKLGEEIQYARMTGNAKDFAAELEPFFEGQALPYRFRVFEGDTHNGVPWDAVNPVLAFLFPLPL